MVQERENLPAKSETSSIEVLREATRQFATFRFGIHLFGLPIEDVIEINRSLVITPVPLAPSYVAGVVNLRGQILTAIHLGRRLGMPERVSESDGLNNLIIGNREEPVSLLVEGIGDVIAVPEDQIEPPPDLIEGLDTRFVKEVCKLPDRLLIVLDAEALQAPPEEAGE